MKKVLLPILTMILFTSLATAQDNTDNVELELPKHSLHFDLIAPMQGNYVLGYENFFNKNVSLEFRGSLITEPINMNGRDDLGFALAIGPKFNISKSKMGRSDLQGFFLKPSIRYENFTRTYSSDYRETNYQNLDFMASIGHRWVFSNRFFLEPSLNFVASYHLKNNSYDNTSNKINFFPTGNVTFGILLFK